MEQSTRLQANSLVWHQQRPGRITASSAHSVLHTNKDNPARSVVLGITTINANLVNSCPLVFGRENESKVFAVMEALVSKSHTGGSLRQTGLYIDSTHRWLAATVDGIITCQRHGKCILEIRCPSTARNSTIEQIMADPTHFIFQGQLHHTHRYYAQ